MKKTTAFSLAEISVVIIIVGVLIAAISSTKNFIRKSKLTTAQSLTKNSPVIDTEDLVLWFETSLKTNFDDYESMEDGTSIENWFDNNEKSLRKINASQPVINYQPQFYRNAFNGAIPGIRFDGSDDYMDIDFGDVNLIGLPYTIFIVEQRRSGVTGVAAILGGSDVSSTANGNLHIGYRNNSYFTFAQFANDLNISMGSFSSIIARIHTASLNTTIGRRYWLNGGDSPDSSSVSTNTLVKFQGMAIGKIFTSTTQYNGDIAEIIIFKRALQTNERRNIENYLSKKYNIPIQ